MKLSARDLFNAVLLANPRALDIPATGYRLDAAFYDPVKSTAERLLSNCAGEKHLLGNVATLHCSNLRDRHFVNAHSGIPLLTGKNLNTENDDDLNYVSRHFAKRVQDEALQSGDILLSCAGTIGKLDFVRNNHEHKLASQQIIRIRPRTEAIPSGYIYAFLSTKLVQGIITSQSAGSVVQVLSIEHIDRLPIPRLRLDIEAVVHDKVLSAFGARAVSRKLLSEASKAVCSTNRLPDLTRCSLDSEERKGEPIHMTVKNRAITGESRQPSEYRLDAHFYNPTALLVVANIKKCGSEVKTVGDVTERVFFCNRFTRTFVDRDHGIPYLAGKNIIQTRPTDLAYLSRSQTNDLDLYRLQKGWILMTCSGTIGRTCLVWKNFEEFVGTHDLIRIVPDASKIDDGYLYAFLSSEYGKRQVLRYRHGSVIDHVTPEQVQRVLISLPSREDQAAIGDKVREAYEKRAEAIRLEDEAQAILMKELTKAPGTKGA